MTVRPPGGGKKRLFWGEKPIGILPGQYFDQETGLHYNWNRYYDPGTGRYVTTDPIGFGGEDENLYRYVLNSPSKDFDENGLRPTRSPYRYSQPQSNPFIEAEVRMLLNAIRQIQPNYSEPATIRTTGSSYNRNDINYLRNYFLSITTGSGRCTQACNAQKRGPKTDPMAPHNAKIREIADQIVRDGGHIFAGGGRNNPPERLISTFGGYKNGRRPDILYTDSSGTLRGINVGRTRADGTPVLREQKALDDLNGPGMLPTTFFCYY